MLLDGSGGSGGGIGFGAASGGLARGLGLTVLGRKIPRLNSGGLRSMGMANGMVESCLFALGDHSDADNFERGVNH